MCGSVRCSSGCGEFSAAEPADECSAHIIQQGGMSLEDTNVFVVDETEVRDCSISI